MHRNKYRIIIPFLAPALALYSLFVLYPYAQAMYVAFTKWKGLRRSPRFVGLDNFEKLLGDDQFWNALTNNLIYLFVLPVITLGFALFMAFMISQKVRFSNFYRITYFFPQVMSVVAIGILWSFVYHPTIGIFTSLLKAVGVESPPIWLGDPDTALWSIVAVTVWQSAGFFMVIFMAGMLSIPKSLYEAAAIDGAGRGTTFFKITLPLLWENMRSSLVFITVEAMNMFGITFTMTQGGPDRSTDVLATLLYEHAFLHSRFGYATSIAMVYFVLVILLSLLIMQMTRRETIEY
ncbi:MAG: carbohydrate ABC transporter permease [bacterium]|jgi:N-acetylglucosamine transport system permease protein